MKPGDVLPNGAIVLLFKTTTFGNVILAVWSKQPTPFITWVSRITAPTETENGNYHADLEAAIRDFKRRA